MMMSLEEEQKRWRQIGGPWWPRGLKVKFLGKNGHDDEREKALELFEVGQILTVKSSRTRSYSSSVQFEEVDGVFNTVMFEPYAEETTFNIYFMIE
jgi:hypothetical protein